jgi:hypothetical protein
MPDGECRQIDRRQDRNYLVLVKPNVKMNDIRLRGLAVAGTEAAGRKSPDNHAQTARNLKRSLRNAAAGARLIQAEGLDNRSAADVAASNSARLSKRWTAGWLNRAGGNVDNVAVRVFEPDRLGIAR